MTPAQNNRSLLQRFTARPKQLFLLDGAGALLTAFLLGIVLVRFEPMFGMPAPVLISMAVTACFFAAYSFTCAFLAGSNWGTLLRIIATANLMYCAVSLALMVYYYPLLTVLGLVYFVGEIVIVGGLAIFEMIVSNFKQ